MAALQTPRARLAVELYAQIPDVMEEAHKTCPYSKALRGDTSTNLVVAEEGLTNPKRFENAGTDVDSTGRQLRTVAKENWARDSHSHHTLLCLSLGIRKVETSDR